ncbi:MAG: SIR2 family protein, partial [Sphaerochaetaceae bacterium]
MRFLINDNEAPDIPERLLQNHEDGNVVFFCGAGISDSAGLPGFKKLVDQIYEKLGCEKDSLQEEAYESKQYDLAISLLESSTSGGRDKVRSKISELLRNPNISKTSTQIHKALLTLSKTNNGNIRLITTNFDQIFEHIIKENNSKINTYIAPALPIVNEDWDGLVYLHGLLNENPKLNNKNQLIISSGDFGQAYLIDRWAARFLGQLFKKYSVCFIGYSLEDPIVRYMTDAITGTRNNGENPPEMFSFCSYNKKEELQEKEYIINKWKSKGITPIPYYEENDHHLLNETIFSWATSYKQELQGKVYAINELIDRKPSISTVEDDIVKKMIWAISDASGKPAETFAKTTPVFDLEWLKSFYSKKYSSNDLVLFGINNTNKRKFEDNYTLLNRPYPDNSYPPKMSIVNSELVSNKCDKIMNWIFQWLLRHLNNPNLIIWVNQNGGNINYNFKEMIIRRLNEISKLEKENCKTELQKIKDNSPDGIPDEAM